MHPEGRGFDVAAVRRDFPALETVVHGRPLVYLDNAATSQKPRSVIDRIVRYYERENANVHRGVHALSQAATDAYEAVRPAVQRFIGASRPDEIVFTRGTTEAINLVAAGFAKAELKAGDEIVISHLEHHSNIVPWQMAAESTGAVVRVIPIDERGALDLEAYERLLGPRTRIVAISHVSNTLGTVNPVGRMIEMAHAVGAPVLVDGAQAVPHAPVDVQALDADFYCFSGHKMFGPTGIGVLYARADRLERLPPWQGGGDMIASVSFDGTTYAAPPHRFEAGTPHIEGVLGLGAALDYLSAMDRDAAARHESALLAYANERLGDVEGIRFIGTADEKVAVISFLVGNLHPYDVGTILDRYGVAVRTGHHCTEPVMTRYGIPGTVRASFAFYNTFAEVDELTEAVIRARRMLS